ncbi:MAG TPA: ferritin-like domain-containing protein [Mycobacteriales bacterium]|nr:ferritin-like domain-containing protein [Mycobacteriales bacterium]
MNRSQALQQALAAEHAIVYGYGVVGAHLRGTGRKRALTALRVNEQRRDLLDAEIRKTGATPLAPLAAYGLPFPVTDAVSAKRLAVQLEEGGAGAAWDLIAASTGSSRDRDRTLAIDWLREAAARITEWGGSVPALPGQPT